MIHTKKTIAISSCQGTSPAVHAAQDLLETAGYEAAIYTDVREMEAAILAGKVSAVLDLTTADLARELLHSSTVFSCDRLTAAAIQGIPQVISLGGLDSVQGFRTTPEQNDRIGQDIAQKACAARGPTAILLPLGGLSIQDVPEGQFWAPEANAALFQSLRNWVYGVKLIELQNHINDPAFAAIAVKTLLRLLS